MINTWIPTTACPVANPATAEALFYDQWVNHSTWTGFSYFGLELTKKLNIGYYVPYDNSVPTLDFDTCRDLWNTSNPSSFTTAGGLAQWLNAWYLDNTTWGGLNTTFGLTHPEMEAIAEWISIFYTYLFNVNKGVPSNFAITTTMGMGLYRNDPINIGDNLTQSMTVAEYLRSLFYSQWSDLNWKHGTWETQLATTYAIGGLTGSPMVGIEPALEGEPPTLLGLDWQKVEAMFDPYLVPYLPGVGQNYPFASYHPYSFINEGGLENYWIPAAENRSGTEYNTLKTVWELDDGNMSLILDWIIRMRDVYTPAWLLRIAPHDNIPTIALDYFYNVWILGGFTNGYTTFFEDVNLSEQIPGISEYFTLGLTPELAENFTFVQRTELFNDYNYLSLTNENGIKTWHAILCNTSVQPQQTAEYALIQAEFGFQTEVLDALIGWLEIFELAFGLYEDVDICAEDEPEPPPEPPPIPGYNILVILGFSSLATIFIIKKKKKN
jgi:hypothetical protein